MPPPASPCPQVLTRSKPPLLARGSAVPPAALAAFRGAAAPRASPEEVGARLAAMPASLAAALLPFQREGVRFALERRGRALIADEMGVGKTLQAIALAACYEVRGRAAGARQPGVPTLDFLGLGVKPDVVPWSAQA
jgi:hypothetical protein